MAVYSIGAAPTWTAIGTGPLLMSVREGAIEVFANAVPGNSDTGIQIPAAENIHLPLAGTIYARPLAGAPQAVVVSFTASS